MAAKEICHRGKKFPVSKILSRISPRISLPGTFLGKIPGRIAPRFWPPGIVLPSENLGEIPGRIVLRFWPLGYLLPGENLGEIPSRIMPRFWLLGISLPGKNLAGIPPGSKNPAAKISPGSQRDSRQDRGGIPPRSRSLFYKGFA